MTTGRINQVASSWTPGSRGPPGGRPGRPRQSCRVGARDASFERDGRGPGAPRQPSRIPNPGGRSSPAVSVPPSARWAGHGTRGRPPGPPRTSFGGAGRNTNSIADAYLPEVSNTGTRGTHPSRARAFGTEKDRRKEFPARAGSHPDDTIRRPPTRSDGRRRRPDSMDHTRRGS